MKDSFFVPNSRNVHPQFRNLQGNDVSMGIRQYCIEESQKCRDILLYLIIDGRHSTVTNLEIIYQEAMTQSFFAYADNFDELVNEIVYPIYSKRFSGRIGRFSRSHRAFRITTAKKCEEYGPECSTVLNHLESTMKRFYSIFHVLNNEFDGSMSSHFFNWERYYGTLVASMNSEFDGNYERMWKSLNSPKTESQVLITQTDVAFDKLQNDLIKLLGTVIPSNNISLTDFLGLIGYNNALKTKNNAKRERDNNCMTFVESFRPTCMNLNILRDLYPLPSLDPLRMGKSTCDLGIYLENWIKYLNDLEELSKVNSKTIGKGN